MPYRSMERLAFSNTIYALRGSRLSMGLSSLFYNISIIKRAHQPAPGTVVGEMPGLYYQMDEGLFTRVIIQRPST